jgi:WD40 repeat protein
MWLVKPNWIFHGNDFPLNSIDCEPAGTKLLTASSIDNSIRLWSIECITNKDSEDELLCTLKQHEGSVN